MPGILGSSFFMLPSPLDRTFVDAFFDGKRPYGHPIMQWLDEAKPMPKATWEKLVKDGVGLGHALPQPAGFTIEHFTVTLPDPETVALRGELLKLATTLGLDLDAACQRVDQVCHDTGLDAFQAINWLRDDEWNRRNRAAQHEYAEAHQRPRWPDPWRFDKWTPIGPTGGPYPEHHPLPDDVVDRAIFRAFPFGTDLPRYAARQKAQVPLAGEKELTRTPFTFDQVALAADRTLHDPVADLRELLKTIDPHGWGFPRSDEGSYR